MNKEQIKYSLIIVVAIIWCIIAIKIFRFFKDSGTPHKPVSSIENIAKEENSIDTFSIKANYPDPFLRKKHGIGRTHKDSTNSSSAKKKTIPTPKTKDKILWPNIIFNGIVSSSNGETVSILLVINGTNHILKKGDIVSDIEVMSVTKDSIMVKFQNNTQFIKRNENN